MITGDIFDLKAGDVVKSYKDKGDKNFITIKLDNDCKDPKEVSVEGGIVERNLNSNCKRITNLYIPQSYLSLGRGAVPEGCYIPEGLLGHKRFTVITARKIKKVFDGLDLDNKPYRAVMSPHCFIFSFDTKVKFYHLV